MADKSRVLEKIKQYINEYNSIYLLANKNFIYTPFLRNNSFSATKKYLLLVAGLEKGCTLVSGIDIQPISCKEYHEIENLYYIYEFSDRIHFLDDHVQCGSLDNYITNGLLTEDEVAMILMK